MIKQSLLNENMVLYPGDEANPIRCKRNKIGRPLSGISLHAAEPICDKHDSFAIV